MRFIGSAVVGAAILLLAGGTALAQPNYPGTRASGIYSATPGNTGLEGPGYANGQNPRPLGGGGYGPGTGALLGTGITPQGPVGVPQGGAPDTSISYQSGLGAAAATGGMPQPPKPQPPRIPKLKNPNALDADNAPPPAERAAAQRRLPAPAVGENAAPDEYLRQARADLRARRKGAAIEALEHAETRLLDRPTRIGAEMQPDETPRVRRIGEARLAAANNDYAAAERILDELLAAPAPR